ncbi:MAG TPA: hypothetical protein VFC39_21575 [Acidobacteriaceae bacterium]|nr:hypothetical protein [Acidobacteriaceae bacterium]
MDNTNSSGRNCRRFVALATVAVSLGLTFATGCSSEGFTGPDAFVTIVPGNTMVGTGATFVLFAGASPTGVTWTITSGTGCTGVACGTLAGATATSVNYIAPVSIPGSTMSVTITATSTTNSSISASETLTVFPVYVQITGPSNTTVVPLTSAQFSATVINDPTGLGVTWSASGSCTGTTQGCGTFRGPTPTQATFVAPPAPALETVNITATSVADPAESATFAVTVPKLAVFVFSPTIPPAVIAGQTNYSTTIQVFGNTLPYTLTATNLPSWATADIGANTVTIHGNPPAGTQGTVYTQINVVDSTAPVPLQGSQSFAITTYPSPATGNSLLNGSYAFFATGWTDGTSVQTTYNGIEYIGSFTADGNGNITGGELDVNSPTTGLTSYSSLGGTYSVQYGTDSSGNLVQGSQTGLVTLVPAGKPPLPLTFGVSLSKIRKGVNGAPDVATSGHFIEFDDSTGISANTTPNSSGIRAQGPLLLQDPAALNAASSPLSGPYAFGMAGYSSVTATSGPCYAIHTCGPISMAGSMILGSSGDITSGIEDVQVAENTSGAVALSGGLADSGATDANGRVTGTITAAATANMPGWPTNFIVYAINAQTFYLMSADPYATNSLITGTAMKQNLADIATTPFDPTEPIVLYGNLTSTTSFSTKGPNGQIRVQVQLLTVVPSSPTAGKMSGQQYVNASGTYTMSVLPGTVGNYSYTVAPATGRVTSSTSSEPYLYLVDTSQGFGTQYSALNNVAPGLFQFQPQTSTTLSSGTYTYYIFNGTSQSAPMETGTLVIPSGGVPSDGTITPLAPGGQDYTAFALAGNVYVAGEPILFSGPVTGTLAETDGVFSHGFSANAIYTPAGIVFSITPSTPTSYFQGCGQAATQGGGFVISSTSFICAPAGGSFAGVHVFEQ